MFMFASFSSITVIAVTIWMVFYICFYQGCDIWVFGRPSVLFSDLFRVFFLLIFLPFKLDGEEKNILKVCCVYLHVRGGFHIWMT